MSYVIRTIDESAMADQTATSVVADASHGYPCRRCLTDARVGESVILASADPFRTDSAYRSRSPIYLHSNSCPSADGSTTLPPIAFERPQSARAYDENAMMVDAGLAEGSELESLIEQFLANPDVSYVHVHNARPGCFSFRVERAA
jgi:hypothetical protein